MKREQISQGLALIPSGVFVLSAAENGRSAGMLVSFVQQAGFEPPLIVIAIARSRPILALIERSRQFAVSVMSPASRAALRRFWKGVPEGGDPFTGLATRMEATGLPIVADAVGFLECALRAASDAGDHRLLVGEVINGGRLQPGEPMVRVRKDGFEY